MVSMKGDIMKLYQIIKFFRKPEDGHHEEFSIEGPFFRTKKAMNKVASNTDKSFIDFFGKPPTQWYIIETKVNLWQWLMGRP